jgi:hypothetical protein
MVGNDHYSTTQPRPGATILHGLGASRFSPITRIQLGDIMDIQKLTTFFMWCTIINGALLVVSIMIFVSAPDFMYTMQSQLFPMTRETFNVVLYSFLGLFKIFFLVFNAVPYGALLIVQKNATASAA